VLKWGAVFLLVLVVAFVGWRVWIRWRLELKLASLRADGMPLNVAELDRWYASPPASKNGALVVTNILAQIVAPKDEEDERLPIVGQAKLPPAGTEWTEETLQLADSFLKKNAEVLRLSPGATQYSQFRYPWDLKGPWTVEGPHCFPNGLSLMRAGVRLHTFDAIVATQCGSDKFALESLTCAVKLADSTRMEPLLISHLVRIACLRYSTESLQYVLSMRALTAEQLTQLSTVWDDTESSAGLERAVIGERAYGNGWFEYWAQRPISWFEADRPVISPNHGKRWLKLYRWVGLWDASRLEYLNMMNSLYAIAHQPLPRQLGLVREWATSGKRELLREMTEGYDKSFSRYTSGTATTRTTRVGLLVKRFRLEKGELPAELPATTLTDPFNGQPLRYKRLAKGYVVYSVGEDGQDDGGDEKKDVCFTVLR
jgi:hypothetical protein